MTFNNNYYREKMAWCVFQKKTNERHQMAKIMILCKREGLVQIHNYLHYFVENFHSFLHAETPLRCTDNGVDDVVDTPPDSKLIVF